MKRTELQRLEDEILIFEDNREILNQLAHKLLKTFIKKHEDMDMQIELKGIEGSISPENGAELHKITLVAKRKFARVSKGVVDSYKLKKHCEDKERSYR